MFLAIANAPRDYAWGSRGEISALLGLEPTSGIESELWLGAHPGSPSAILEPEKAGGAHDLAAWIAADPVAALGQHGGTQLTFLLKVLAATSPLSLQAHPTAEQAIVGFARENAAGIPFDAPFRNYKDASPKPELIYALSETFEALCGFRSATDTRADLARLIELDAGATLALQRWHDGLRDDNLRSVFEWLIERGDGVDAVVTRIAELAVGHQEFEFVARIAAAYPGDPGIAIAFMLNHVILRPGEAIYLPAGNVHAYLRGVGIELMTSSDNVLRGGLTAKHIDIPELLSVLDFTPGPAPCLVPESLAGGVKVFRPAVKDFVLVVLNRDGSFPLSGPAIVLCTEGTFTLRGAMSAREVSRGSILYVTPEEGMLQFVGLGSVFVATAG